MKVLVTGASGFTGLYLMRHLATRDGVIAIGLVRHKRDELGQKSGSSFVVADLQDRRGLFTAIEKICPDTVIHLAGLTRGNSTSMYETNVIGTNNLLDASIDQNPDCRVLVISSSAVYGYAGTLPISETTPLRPVNTYGLSKVEQEKTSLNYGNGDAAIAIARPFNLAGPGQANTFLCGRIVNQVVKIEFKEKDTLDLLEVSTARDLIDVRDVVRGYWALVSLPNFSRDCSGKVFNLGSGSAYRISEIISIIEEITGDHYKIRLPDTIQDAAIPTQRSDNSRITSLTGWKPIIPLEETLRDMLDYERKKSAREIR